jgi:hypothetical protein
MGKHRTLNDGFDKPQKWEPIPQVNSSVYFRGDGYDRLALYQRWLRKQGRFWWLWWFIGFPSPKKFFRIIKKAMFN